MPAKSINKALFKATFRVLVIKNNSATETHLRVIAICLEQNLVGRGATIDEALDELIGIVYHSVRSDWEDLAPAYQPDPDPELLKIFESKITETSDGDTVLLRLDAYFEFVIGSGTSKKSPQEPSVTFQECAV